jgi:zinc protease
MNESFRSSPPEPLEPIAFHLAKPFETTLANGLKVVVFEDGQLPLVSFRLAFFSGDAADPANAAGLTSAAATLMTEGTENYSSKQLAETIERLGASLNVNSSDDFAIMSASSLSFYAEDMISLMAEVMLRPAFPESEVDLYRRNTIEHLKFQRSQSPFLAAEQAGRLLYGEHPYGRVSPTKDDIEKLTREDLAKFHGRTFVPGNAVMIAAGDLERDELLKQLEAHFGTWSGEHSPEIAEPEAPTRSGRTLTIVDRPGSAQSNIVISNRAIKRTDPDFFPVLVMNQILGAGASSRVFMNLREDKGYTYGAYTRFDSKLLAGTFEATAEVRTQVTGDSLKEFFHELERIRTEKVSEEELADAVSYLVGVFPLRAETQEGRTNLIVNQQLYRLPDDYLETYRDNIAAVTADDVKRVAEKYVKPDEAAIVIVGDGGEILRQAGEYAASVEIFDIDGARKDIADYKTDPNAEPADVAGTWSLKTNFQGMDVELSLVLEQNGNAVTGKLETPLGEGSIESGSIAGSKMTATAIAEMQGQSVEFVIGGVVTGNEMQGSIANPLLPEPLTFSATRG